MIDGGQPSWLTTYIKAYRDPVARLITLHSHYSFADNLLLMLLVESFKPRLRQPRAASPLEFFGSTLTASNLFIHSQPSQLIQSIC